MLYFNTNLGATPYTEVTDPGERRICDFERYNIVSEDDLEDAARRLNEKMSTISKRS